MIVLSVCALFFFTENVAAQTRQHGEDKVVRGAKPKHKGHAAHAVAHKQRQHSSRKPHLTGHVARKTKNVPAPRPEVIKEVTISTPATKTTVEIKNGEVYVNDSPVLKIRSLKNEDDRITLIGPAPVVPVNPVPAEIVSGSDEAAGHAVLGVFARDAYSDGAFVTGVVPGSPADEAGFAFGDVITMVGDLKISSASDLVNAVGAMKPGDKVTLTFHDCCDENTEDVTLGDSKELERDDDQCIPRPHCYYRPFCHGGWRW